MTALITAAGQSRRMGGEKKKELQKIQNRFILERVYQTSHQLVAKPSK